MITKKSFFLLMGVFMLSCVQQVESASRIHKTPTTKSNSSTKTIRLYTYPNCGACHKVINFLKKKNWYDRVVIINADEEKNYEDFAGL